MDELVDRAIRGDAAAARVLEDTLDRLAWRSATGDFPSKPPSSGDLAWIDTCVRLRRDRKFSGRAATVLSNLSPGEIDTARRRVLAAPPPPRNRPLVPGELLARYRHGDHEAVWSELAQLGALRSDSERQEAAAVAGETMAVAARAIDELVRRLGNIDYPLRARARHRPVSAKSIGRLAKVCRGPVAVSLAAFWQVVGGVDLAPQADSPLPSWWPTEVPPEMVDPLVVGQLDELWSDIDEWNEISRGVG